MLDVSMSNAPMICVLMLSFCMLTVILQSVIRLGVKLPSLTQRQLLVQVLKCISMLGGIISNAIMFCILMHMFGRLTVILQSVIRLGVKMPSLTQRQLLAQVFDLAPLRSIYQTKCLEVLLDCFNAEQGPI
jgi:hypothetical protein